MCRESVRDGAEDTTGARWWYPCRSMSRAVDDPERSARPDASPLGEVIVSLPAFPAVEAALATRSPVHVHKLVGASKAVFVAELRRRTGLPVLYITSGEESADAARMDLELFLDEPVHHLPEHTTRPYEAKQAHTDVAASRLETLTHLAAHGDGVIVATAKGLAEKVVGPDLLRRNLLRFKVGDAIDLDEVTGRLTYLGYERCQAVEEVGDYALRGGILDVYSLGGLHPIRIETEYDEVASVREFDVHTQRSLNTLTQAVLIPRHELILDQDTMDLAVLELGEEDAEAGASLQEAFDTEVHPAGIERMAGRLHQGMTGFSSYLPEQAIVVIEEPGLVRSRIEVLWEEITQAHETTSALFPHVSPPDDLYLGPDAFFQALATHATVRLSDLSPDAGAEAKRVPVRSHPPETYGRQIEMWRTYLRRLDSDGHRITIYCDNAGQRERLEALLIDHGIRVELPLGVLSAGFVLEEAKLAVLTDHEFFGRPRRRRARKFRSGFGLKELKTLKVGSYIVHVEHGIGQYHGLTRIEVNGQHTDVLQIAYQKGDKLYVPVSQLDLIQRYSSEDGKKAVLSRLGGTGWAKTKQKAKKHIKEIAGELIRLYALRKAHPGHQFGPDTPWQGELEGSFPYDETPDQRTAIDLVKADMEAPTPMDRLVCGDVGYGKTEVAVRAAFKAVMEGKQVAILVPTTILCEQHFNTLTDRFKDFPVRLEMLSRFRSAKEKKEILARIKDGQLDLVVGTHALLGKSVRFKNLGLLVVDEEQRFGVTHKERIKEMRANVDVLTLTATPIPRTLNMSMLGVRDITVIQTPPQGRMPVQTEIAEFDRELIQEMLLRESDRGGQSFFVHNRVESIHTMGMYIRKLCPQLRVGVAHGQMREHALEQVMHAFIAGEMDVLVATMIIENGLDIPSVNTMIVNRADAFGLSQLYQLRGRVGRSTVKAFCSFLVPTQKALTETAMKRLRAIAEFDELGSGFALAMRDLEIRGAGNLLGSEQHGHVVAIGFEMYCKLVDEAVRELKGLPLVDRPEPRMTTDIDAFLPDDYVEDAEQKVAFYKRLADAEEMDEVLQLEDEIKDRYGRLSTPALSLFALRRLRLLGAEIGLGSVDVRRGRIEFEFLEEPTPQKLKGWMQRVTTPVEFVTAGRFALKAKGSLAEALALARAMAGVDAEGVRVN